MRLATIIKISVLSLALLAVPTPALAQDGGDDAAEDSKGKPDKKSKRRSRRAARKQFKRGAKLAGEQQYDEAIEAFRAAYELDPQPDTLYNLGQVSRLKGDISGAYEYYEKYLAVAPKGRLARSAKRFMKSLKERVDEENARMEREQKLQAENQKAQQEAVAARERAEQEKQQGAQALEQAQDELQKTQKHAALMEEERDFMKDAMLSGRGSTKRIIGTSMLAAGGLALGMGLLAGLDARSAHNQLDGQGPDDRWSESSDWVHDHGQSSQTRMLIFSITGALLVGGGATMYLLGDREAKKLPNRDKGVAVTPTVSQRSAGLSIAGRF